MNTSDNFKRHSRSRNRRTVDGIISDKGKPRAGSIDFQSDKGSNKETVSSIDNFNRPEGFTPARQPMVAAEGAAAGSIATNSGAFDRPRRSPFKPEPPQKRWKRISNRLTWFDWKTWLKWRTALKRLAIILAFLILAVGAFLGWKIYKNTSSVFQGNIFGLFDNTRLKGEDKGRVNILLTGTSEDDVGHDGAKLTDSIMILSIDTQHNTGFMMSIPRDLWVDYGTDSCSVGNAGKINAVYECGDEVNFRQAGFPNGGIGLMEKVIDRDFGIDINYYVKIDYTAVRQGVNAVGGIDFTVKSSDPRGLYDPSIDWSTHGPLVKLTNGTHHLDGRQALDLARARGDAYGSYGFAQADFTRTQNQRAMMLALKDKALSVGVLSNPAKISSLLDAVGKNVKTDFHTNEIRRLYELVKNVNNNNIQSIGLADDNVKLVVSYAAPTSPPTSALAPAAGVGNFSSIQAFMKRITSNDPVIKEGATVVVLNGTSKSGLAQQEATALLAKGITVASVSNAYKLRKSTVIVSLNNNQKTATKAYLEQQFKTTASTDLGANPEARNYQADFVIILGSDALSSSQ